MSNFHLAHLSLGSNIEPEVNLPKAVDLLLQFGDIVRTSSVWESKPVGGTGGHYLNACALYKTRLTQKQLKVEAIFSIERQLGRRRSDDKFAPRTIDIDIVLFDGKIIGGHWLSQAFVVVPLAEIVPEFYNPDSNEPLKETATRLRQSVWMEVRRGILN